MLLGIDLGTTYSVAAYVDKKGEAKVIPNTEGSTTTPSVVYVESQDSVIVGQAAKDYAATSPQNVISFVKNVMGKTKADGTPEGYVTEHGTYSPEAISAFILKKIVSDSNNSLGLEDSITDVVVTKPAYFNDAQNKATEDAIAIAGLNRIALINEPTAAAYYYASTSNINHANILVYDLGGGTFDVTIVRVDDNKIEVVSTGGLSRVGGSFFDTEIANRVCDFIQEKYGVDLTLPEYADVYQDILGKAERAKISLSQTTSAAISVRFKEVSELVTFTREDIDDIVGGLYARTESVMRKALKDVSMDVSEIDKILLVGGSGRIPFIAEHIEEFFGKKPSREVHPDHVVALGAALYGQQLLNRSVSQSKEIVDVCSHGLGINATDPETGEVYNDILIPKNTRLPASVERSYRFDKDVETVYLNVLEGDRKEIKYCSTVCATDLALPQKLLKGELVNIRLEIDIYQIVHIYVRIPSAKNAETEVVFDRKSNLSASQVYKWKQSTQKKIFQRKEKKTEKKAEKNIEKTLIIDKSKAIPKIVESAMEGIVGMDEVKKCLRDLKNRYDMSVKRGSFGKTDFDDHMCVAILGKSGMGMTSAANRVAHALYKFGVSAMADPVIAYYDDLVKADEESTTQAIQNIFQSAMNGVLIIDNFEDFYSENENAAGMVAVKYLVKAYSSAGKNIRIIIAGDDVKIKKIFDANPRFERIFSSYTIELLGLSASEYVKLLHQYAEYMGYVIDPDADPVLEAHFKRTCGTPEFEYFYSLVELFDEAKKDVANKAAAKRHATDNDYSIIRKENFGLEEKVKSLEELKKELFERTGLTKVKAAVGEIIDIYENTFARAKDTGVKLDEDLGTLHMIFTGPPGTGKTTIARLLGQIYRELGVIEKGQFIEVSRENLVSNIVGDTAKQVEKYVDMARGGILFIDEAYNLCKDDSDTFGMEALDTLVRLVENYRSEMVVILAGYGDDIEELLKRNEGLPSRFKTTIEFEPYSLDECVEIFHYMANHAEPEPYIIEGRAERPLKEAIQNRMRKPNFGNGRDVRNIYDDVRKAQLRRLGTMEDWGENEARIIRAADFGILEDYEAKAELHELLSELNNMTGLFSVKGQINSLVNFIRINEVRKQQGLDAKNPGTMHMVFAGSPGTGKTTIAELVGKIYKNLGILPKGHMVCVGREDLVAGFVGQTAGKTKKVLESALGGVLFIDEAYSLATGGDNDFGKEAVDTMIKYIEEHRDDMVVIVAGYTEDMNRFLDMNQGLRSRFKNWISFEDYSVDDMLEIFYKMVTGDGYIIQNEVLLKVRDLIELHKSHDKDFANARGVRIIKENIVMNMANRLASLPDVDALTPKDLMTITEEDIY